MKKNNNVALCYNNISIEGTVEETGDWTKVIKLWEYIQGHPLREFLYSGREKSGKIGIGR